MRYLRKRRELELRDLGGLVFDMYRFGSKRQDLVRDKLQAMFAADRELREFEQLLGRRPRRLDVREAGIGGACRNCQQLYSTEAGFCSRCGQAVTDGARPDTIIEVPSTAAPAGYSRFPEPEPQPEPEPAFEPQAEAWQDGEPQEPEPQDGGRRRFGRRVRKAPEPQPAQAWQQPEPETPAWQDPESPPPEPEPEPEPEPQAPAYQGPVFQPQAAQPQAQEGGRRFGRRRRKTVGDDGQPSEAQRQQQDWEAQYQASVEAQRQAWQEEQEQAAQREREREHEDETRVWQAEPEASPPGPESDGQDNRHDPAAPTEGGLSGLEAGDPLASRSGDRRR